MRATRAWQTRGKCYGSYTIEYVSEKVPLPGEPRKLCEGCPVIKDCKAYGVAHFEEGTWGGTSKYERLSYSPYVIVMTRIQLRIAGQLEHREFVPQAIRELEAKLQQEYNDPTSQLEVCQAAILSQLLEEIA